ncbi:uncharacterized protein NP_0698A [Natronomonas pharaonis DSM 2160]|uniref:Uncharacterized protein n=1 Tax=Natronomonas pharaonis (strain ATCC 35678 / DSM 2160 / CIP 103997 / JCM 8858 / NBRC 14720 / NCIMB 2260 / Gabara) TaxID=348780 RepID=A0A1U7EU17_NATPD|nr:DUF5784 family protein [Natronomonas pharaonis]CAI48440.1 uncharacterized protein NP_0698A [Natronomonas pharaonis DSM 2160]
MAGPLRFRRSNADWTRNRVREALLAPLEDRFGARLSEPWFAVGDDRYDAVRLEMDNGDIALFCFRPGRAYWLGNTETPEPLWRTNKETFSEAPDPVSRWAQRELTARIEVTDPWLADYEHLTWFFLPVFCSKDGRETTRRFFAEDAAGFPDADADAGLSFYESLLESGRLDDDRYTMAAKLGTSAGYDVTRMRATMSEFTVAKLFVDAGLDFDPEVEQESGHALDFAVDGRLVEVTRPEPPARRTHADHPVAAVEETGRAKRSEQLAAHPEAALFVDCTSFTDAEWSAVAAERPTVGHEPTVVFRARPSGHIEGYRHGTLPFDLDGALSTA